MQRPLAKWATNLLNADKKRKRADTSKLFLEHFEVSSDNVLGQLGPAYETRVQHFDPETRQ